MMKRKAQEEKNEYLDLYNEIRAIHSHLKEYHFKFQRPLNVRDNANLAYYFAQVLSDLYIYEGALIAAYGNGHPLPLVDEKDAPAGASDSGGSGSEELP